MATTLELADRGVSAVYDEICRREAGEPADPRFDAYIDYCADAGAAIAAWEWPGQRRFRLGTRWFQENFSR